MTKKDIIEKEDQSKKHFNKLDPNRVKFRLEGKNSAKIVIMMLEIPLEKPIQEYFDSRYNGKKVSFKKALEKIPSCCKPLPTENGNYVCNCKKHIVRIDGNNHSPLVQIAKIPKQISDQDLCRHLCK